MQVSEAELEAIVAQIKQSPKYKNYDLCEDTVRDILLNELPHHKKLKDAVKAARRKLHGVIAPYLGDPDYVGAKKALDVAFQSGDAHTIRQTCTDILRTHDTTRERLEIVEQFYARIFEVTGTPQTILDIACGLNPLTFLWMGLPDLRLFAYDIHAQRVALLNHYFGLQGIHATAKVQDVLVNFPQESGDVALLLKELHRFERRQRGCSLPLLDALKVRHLVVSLPTFNLTGQRDLREYHRHLMSEILAQRAWQVTEIEFSNELVFCIGK